MRFSDDQLLVRDIARAVVARVAPAELPVFRVVSNAYFDDPDRTLSRRDGAGLLDFGPGEVAVLLTPVVLAAISQATQHLLGELARKAMVQSGQAAVRVTRKMFHLDKGDDAKLEAGSVAPGLELSDNDWAEVRRIVFEVVRRYEVPVGTAAHVADEVVSIGREKREE